MKINKKVITFLHFFINFLNSITFYTKIGKKVITFI